MKLSTLGLSTAIAVSAAGCGASTQSVLADLNANHEGVTQNPDGTLTSIACHESKIRDNAYDIANGDVLSAIRDTCNNAQARISGITNLGKSEGKNGDKYIYCTKIKASVQCE